MKDLGVTVASAMIKQLIANDDVAGFHFCTLNLERSVQRVLESLKWIGHPETSNRLIVVSTILRI